MKILYDYFYPAYKAGGPSQSLRNLADLLAGDLPLRIIASDHDLDGSVLPVEKDRWLPYDRDATVFYNAKGRAGIGALIRADDPEPLFVNGIFSVAYNLLPLLRTRARRIVSVRGMLHPGALSQKPLKKKIWLAAWKLLGLHRRCEFHATTEEEAGYIRDRMGAQARVWVIPNVPRRIGFCPLAKPAGAPLRLCTVALVSPMKNHHLVLEALQQADFPVVYTIYGPVKDAAYWERCRALIGAMPAHVAVTYEGDLDPASVPEALAAHHAYIQPSRSENFGHSLYEALAAGKPLITSRATPWNGLEEDGIGANVPPDDVAALGEAIARLYTMDEQDFSAACLRARDRAMAATDSETLRREYLNMFAGK